MRAVIVGSTYINPTRRGKLRELAGLGCAVAAAVPEHWHQPVTGSTLTATWGDDAGVRIVPVRVRKLPGRYGGMAWDRGTLRKLLRDFRPDLVQIEEEPVSQVAAVTTRIADRLKIPSILFSAETIAREYRVSQRWRRRRSLGRARGFIGGSRPALNLLTREHTGRPATVIHQIGVGIPRLLTPVPHRGFTIGFTGRLVPERGLDLLLRACVQIHGAWELLVVGSGPAQEELEALAERLGVASRVTWAGALPADDLDMVWPRLDCLVAPSRTTREWSEPYGRAVMQAMGYGVPIIGSSSGVLPEVIGPAGLVVPEEDVAALADAIGQLLASPERRQEMAQTGRRRVMNEFVDAAIARKTHAFWETVLRG